MGGGRSLGGSDGFGCKVDWWCGAEAHAQHAAAFDVPNTPNNSHSKLQVTILSVFLARCSAKFHDKKLQFIENGYILYIKCMADRGRETVLYQQNFRQSMPCGYVEFGRFRHSGSVIRVPTPGFRRLR